MDNKEFKFLVKLFLFIVSLCLIYTIFPYIDVLALSIAFAYMAKPLFDKLKPKFGNAISSMLCLLFVIAPMVILGVIVFYQLFEFLQSLNINYNNLIVSYSNIVLLITKQINYFYSFLGSSNSISEKEVINYINGAYNYIEPHIAGLLSKLLLLPEIIIKIIMGIFITYYLLKDGHHIKGIILDYVPEKYYLPTKIYIENLNKVYQNLFTGTILTSVAIGILSFIGFVLFGVPNALLLAVITGIFALLPIIGGWGVYVPVALYYLAIGNTYVGLGIWIYGTVFLSLMPDFLIRPYIVGKDGDAHPITVLLAFLVAPLTLGIAGFALGPIIFGAFEAFFKVKKELYLINSCISETNNVNNTNNTLNEEE